MEAINSFLNSQTALSLWTNLGINTAIAFIIAFVLLKLEKKIVGKWIAKYDRINARFAGRAIRFVIIFIATMWVIMSSTLTQSFGSSLFQGTAVLAAVAGFAAKPILSDMFCGFMISTTKPFNIGDRIELDDGTTGIVKDITIRHVVLQGIDTLKIVIPNSEINSKQITNLSHMTDIRSIHFRFTVGLDTRPEQAKQVILDAVRQSPHAVPRKGNPIPPFMSLLISQAGWKWQQPCIINRQAPRRSSRMISTPG